MKITSEYVYNEYMDLLKQGEIKGAGWVRLKEMFDKMDLTEKRVFQKTHTALFNDITDKNRWR